MRLRLLIMKVRLESYSSVRRETNRATFTVLYVRKLYVYSCLNLSLRSGSFLRKFLTIFQKIEI